MTAETALQDLLDREAIRDLIFRHTDAVNRADYEGLVLLYTPDAVWESQKLGLHFEGTRQFVDFLVESGAGFELFIQTASNPVVELLDADTARASTTIREMMRTAGDGAMNLDQHGMYFDELTKVEGTWQFGHRHFVPVLVASGTVTGTLVTDRSDLRP
jgi:ketosteroid isomerase-like protein